MRIGLVSLSPRLAAQDARLAEDLGFDMLAVGEHLFWDQPTPNGFVQLAVAAGATERIRLVSAITVLPLYPAALVAKMAACLDQASSGRLELGLGAGGEYPKEFAAAGISRASRFSRLDEGVQIIRSLFAGATTFRGEFADLEDLTLNPMPVQPGGPPIWLAGRKPGALRRAGRFADVWLPYMVTAEMFGRGLASVRAAAVEHGRRAEDVAGAMFVSACADRDAEWARRVGIEAVSATYGQDFSAIADRYLALGGVAAVTSRLLEYAEAGASRMLIQVAAADEHRERVIRTFAEDVLPALR
jgi:alkanesulfonate monooxygenase SsuD/methylene tetrahydromethanopterin reductase-like flavin-dependent oxidoreductase (luciferase family)